LVDQKELVKGVGPRQKVAGKINRKNIIKRVWEARQNSGKVFIYVRLNKEGVFKWEKKKGY